MLTRIDPIEILGVVAGILTTAAYIPQVFRTWRLKSAGDISLVMISLTSGGILLWFLYGVFIRSLPVAIANCITFILTFTVLILKVRFGRAQRHR